MTEPLMPFHDCISLTVQPWRCAMAPRLSPDFTVYIVHPPLLLVLAAGAAPPRTTSTWPDVIDDGFEMWFQLWSCAVVTWYFPAIDERVSPERTVYFDGAAPLDELLAGAPPELF